MDAAPTRDPGESTIPVAFFQHGALNVGDARQLDIAMATLQSLVDDSGRFDHLLALQRFLLRRIRLRERFIQRVRKLKGCLRPM